MSPRKKKKEDDEPKPVPSMGGVYKNWIWEQIWDPELKQHYYLIFDMKHPDQAPDRILDFEPKMGQVFIPWQTDFVEKELIYLPSGIEEYGTEDKLWEEQRQFIYDYCDVLPTDHVINVQYVALTWLFDKFNEVSYRRFLGDWGTGKSRAMTAIGLCCYRPIIIKAAATPAGIFRSIEQTRGTLLIDEANFEKKSEIWGAIMGVLNAGYERTGGIIRCGKDTYALEAFQAFGPKILASRVRFPDRALESRCLTCITYQTHRADIPVNLDNKFFERSHHLRNKWLLWRFRNYSKPLNPAPDILKLTTVIPRLRQIIAPLAALRENDGFFADYIKQKHEEVMEERRQSWEGQVMQALFDLYDSPETVEADGTPVFFVSDVADRYRENLNLTELKEFTPRKCGGVLTRLGFKTESRRIGQKKAAVVLLNLKIFDSRCRDYGLNGGYHTKAPKAPKAPKLDSFHTKNGSNGMIGRVGMIRARGKPSQEIRIKMILEAIHHLKNDENEFEYAGLVNYCDEQYGATHADTNEMVAHLQDKGKITKIGEGRYQLV